MHVCFNLIHHYAHEWVVILFYTHSLSLNLLTFFVQNKKIIIFYSMGRNTLQYKGGHDLKFSVFYDLMRLMSTCYHTKISTDEMLNIHEEQEVGKFYTLLIIHCNVTLNTCARWTPFQFFGMLNEGKWNYYY